MRQYRCLDLKELNDGNYALVPIRDEDKYPIMQWRNEQLDILRQSTPLTKEMQEAYFKNVVDSLFIEEKPLQLLFSFLYNGTLIGYGGLVHINWKDANAEISFLLATERATSPQYFAEGWSVYLRMISLVAFQYLSFHKIYTYSYSIRGNLFPVLLENGFVEEARLREHVNIKGEFKDVMVHSLFKA
jgi:hypothetical protein